MDNNKDKSRPIDFSANITIDKVAAYAGTNLKLFVVVTESDIQQNWQGLTHLEFVERDMYPSASGTTLDFSSGSIIDETINFSVDPNWNLENCELIIFVQDMTSKEVLQVEKAALDLPTGTNNVLLQTINLPNDGDVICENFITPTIQIKNKGTDTLKVVNNSS